jgi:CubicO group peptidase (beta-lactamase class C family)
VGSVAKQFTAACIFLLEQQGKLSIDDPIQKYLPEMPVFQEEIVTIRHLINHTSGLRDYI